MGSTKSVLTSSDVVVDLNPAAETTTKAGNAEQRQKKDGTKVMSDNNSNSNTTMSAKDAVDATTENKAKDDIVRHNDNDSFLAEMGLSESEIDEDCPTMPVSVEKKKKITTPVTKQNSPTSHNKFTHTAVSCITKTVLK